jgi:Tol biopolymer transport system component
MRLRSRIAIHVALLTSLFLCSLASGCRTEEHFFDVTGELFVLSAADHHDEALDRAREWRPDAQLTCISAMVSSTVPGKRPGASLTYMFHSPSTADSFYILDFSSGNWSAEEATKGGMTVTPPPIVEDDWSLDSVDAWSIALANGGEDFLLHYQDPMTSMSVTLDYWRTSTGQERLAWRVHLFIVHGPGLDIRIDPYSGDIIEVQEGSMSGTLVATTPTLPPRPWAPLPACTPATPESGRVSGLAERIAFESSRDGVAHIYLMDPDGTNIEQLTEGLGGDSDAAWCPDGRRIAFSGTPSTNMDIYVVDADGANLRRLTDDPGYDRGPTWSPDGSRIAFSSDRDGNYNLYVMNADGSNLSLLTDHPFADESPDWSPDGCRIVFTSNRDHAPDSHIYVIGVDGSELVQLTDGPTTDYAPRWSPDGSKVAFWSFPTSGCEGGPDIYVMNQDGSDKVRLTIGPCAPSDLVSYPDLTRIAFSSLQTTEGQGGQDSDVVSDGVPLKTPLTRGSCYGSVPVWSPDGTQILFAMGRNDPSGSDIFIMEADGSNVIQLTHEPGYNIPCSWRK